MLKPRLLTLTEKSFRRTIKLNGLNKGWYPAVSKNWFLGFRGIIIFFFLFLRSFFIVEKHGTGVRKIEIKKKIAVL